MEIQVAHFAIENTLIFIASLPSVNVPAVNIIVINFYVLFRDAAKK